LAAAAGRLTLEKKLLVKLNEGKKKNLQDVGKSFRDSDKIDSLPEEDFTDYWKVGVILYTVATPLVWMSMVLFYATSM
jgi:hypothetical protein